MLGSGTTRLALFLAVLRAGGQILSIVHASAAVQTKVYRTTVRMRVEAGSGVNPSRRAGLAAVRFLAIWRKRSPHDTDRHRWLCSWAMRRADHLEVRSDAKLRRVLSRGRRAIACVMWRIHREEVAKRANNARKNWDPPRHGKIQREAAIRVTARPVRTVADKTRKTSSATCFCPRWSNSRPAI